jgi:hypothetical protein
METSADKTEEKVSSGGNVIFRFITAASSAAVTFLLVVCNFIVGLTIAYMMGDPTNDLPR